eukprot:CAMPEP_0182448016 /NCGR_PEP_ID=MMETSP1172-20130603/22701_1 /TAXON_ID=708627 /ORGANISM="Timspurckia oligopyrenoides, Strain CCMP3278" /LENGTH=474 /DNA_ID=CAMNT_0024644711 /DNA_START=272 /DNA_END=1696 /DNA_ORIENTATION=+
MMPSLSARNVHEVQHNNNQEDRQKPQQGRGGVRFRMQPRTASHVNFEHMDRDENEHVMGSGFIRSIRRRSIDIHSQGSKTGTNAGVIDSPVVLTDDEINNALVTPVASPKHASAQKKPAPESATPPGHKRFFPMMRRPSRSATPAPLVAYSSVGFTEEPNSNFRPTMEDAHVIVEHFSGRSNEAFFGIYDGHGGRDAVEVVEKCLHIFFEEEIEKLRLIETDLDDSGAALSESGNVSDHLFREPAGASLVQNPVSALKSETSKISKSKSSTKSAMSRDESTSKPLEKVDNVLDAFTNAYRRTDLELLEAKCHYVGSTVVTCYIRHNGRCRTLYTANAGDARAVLSRNSCAIRLTFDHKANAPEEQKRIGQSGGFVAANRVNGVLSVSRALGDHAMKYVVSCDPFYTEYELNDTDSFIIIACDGLWDVVSDDEAVQFVSEKLAKAIDPQVISRKLVKLALDRNSTDNISVMVVKL